MGMQLQLLTTTEVAGLLRISPRTVRLWARVRNYSRVENRASVAVSSSGRSTVRLQKRRRQTQLSYCAAAA